MAKLSARGSTVVLRAHRRYETAGYKPWGLTLAYRSDGAILKKFDGESEWIVAPQRWDPKAGPAVARAALIEKGWEVLHG